MKNFYKNNKYIGAFIFKDEDGIVDRSVEYLLQEMFKQVSELYIISYTSVGKNERDKLSRFTDKIYTISNNQSETNMYYFLWREIEKIHLTDCEGIVFFDDSFFGPIYSLDEMFYKMKEKKCDFWSIAEIPERINRYWQKENKHLTAGFLVVKKRLFNANLLGGFFEGNLIEDFLEYFRGLGFKEAVYIEFKSYNSNEIQNNMDYSKYITYSLIVDSKYPFLYKDCFKEDIYDLTYTSGEELLKIMGYIKDSLIYDIDIIWEYVLRRFNIVDIYNKLRFNYVLPVNKQVNIGEKKFPKTAVFIHLYYMDLLDELFLYIQNIPSDIDIIITSLEKHHSILLRYIKRLRRKKNILLLEAPNRGRDVAALLITLQSYLLKYEYICFIHDKKTSAGIGSMLEGKSFRYMMWENLLKSSGYINNIRMLLNDNPRLGLVAPPMPYHSNYFYVMGNTWSVEFQNTKALLDKLNINVELDPEYGPIALSNSFWCKTKALAPLFVNEFALSDFQEEPYPAEGALGHSVERCLIYIAQSQGYFFGTVENNEYAGLHMINFQKMLQHIIKSCQEKIYFSDFYGLSIGLQKSDLLEFCKKFSDIYIYGAGEMGHRLFNVLQMNGINVEGFVISDGYDFLVNLNIPCYYLSQLVYDDIKTGIIVAANRKNTREIVITLQEKGFKNIFCKCI